MNNPLQDRRVLVTGVNGQVGRALVAELAGQCELIKAARSGADVDFDLENFDQIRSVIAEVQPDIVLNPAAYTQVDQAEDEPERAMRINADAPGVLAEACKQTNALLVHYSTDYVFNGRASQPYKETDMPDPINTYGASKLAGERAISEIAGQHLILRTCWVYDALGKNFPNTILEKAKTTAELKVVDDQVGTPTSARLIADLSRRLVERAATEGLASFESDRLFHVTSGGACSWFEFASRIVELAAESGELQATSITPVKTGYFPTKAERPHWSVLDTDRLSGRLQCTLPGWEEDLDDHWWPAKACR